MAKSISASVGANKGVVGLSFTGELRKGDVYAMTPQGARAIALQLIEKAYIAEQLEAIEKNEKKSNIVIVDPIKEIRA